MHAVTLVIPVYNTEKYIERCIVSVLEQSLEDIEIIFINDCSTDNSSKIINDYMAMDNRIQIITHDRNRGLSYARNTGIKNASGDYICFLDSDDWIDSNYIEHMYKCALDSKSNIINNINVLRELQNGVTKPLNFGNLKITKDDFFDANSAIYNIMWSACTHMYKRKFIEEHGLRFPEGIVFEDMYFQPVSYMHVDKIYITNGMAYHYLVRHNSICRGMKVYNKYINYYRMLNLVFDTMTEEKYLENKACLLFPESFLIPSEIEIDNNLYNIMYNYYSKVWLYIEKYQELYSIHDIQYIKEILSGVIPVRTPQNSIVLNKLRDNIRKSFPGRVK